MNEQKLVDWNIIYAIQTDEVYVELFFQQGDWCCSKIYSPQRHD